MVSVDDRDDPLVCVPTSLLQGYEIDDEDPHVFLVWFVSFSFSSQRMAWVDDHVDYCRNSKGGMQVAVPYKTIQAVGRHVLSKDVQSASPLEM